LDERGPTTPPRRPHDVLETRRHAASGGNPAPGLATSPTTSSGDRDASAVSSTAPCSRHRRPRHGGPPTQTAHSNVLTRRRTRSAMLARHHEDRHPRKTHRPWPGPGRSFPPLRPPTLQCQRNHITNWKPPQKFRRTPPTLENLTLLCATTTANTQNAVRRPDTAGLPSGGTTPARPPRQPIPQHPTIPCPTPDEQPRGFVPTPNPGRSLDHDMTRKVAQFGPTVRSRVTSVTWTDPA